MAALATWLLAAAIATADSVPAGEAAWQNAIDLLPLIDPEKDTVKGQWVFQKGGLVGDMDNNGRIEIPYQPPEEYDFRVEFSRPSSLNDGSNCQFLAKAGHEFMWSCFAFMKPSKNIFGFAEINGKNANYNPSGTDVSSPRGGRHVSLVEVRNTGLRGYHDGKFVVEWKTDYSDMGLPERWRLRNRGLLGLGSQCRTVFHRAQVREVTGKGKFTRNVLGITPEEEVFIKEVAALSPEQQVARVIAKLKELNQSFDGQETHKVERGAVTELAFSTAGVTDISPLKALTSLKRLAIAPAAANRKGTLASLAALKSLSLTQLWCQNNPIADLTPLGKMPLTLLSCGGTKVDDLEPLKGMKLSVLSCNDTPVADLTPLQDMPLAVLWCHNTKVIDLEPLKALPLQELKCDFVPTRDNDILKRIKTLTKINDTPAATFMMRAGFAQQPPTPAKAAAVPPPAQATGLKTPTVIPRPQAGASGFAEQAQARDEIRRFCAKVRGFAPVDLPSSGKIVLSPKNSLTIDMLRGVAIDDNPPVLKAPDPPYTGKECDDCEPGKARYVAQGIQPFRFRFFNNEFWQGSMQMQDYSTAHGFNIARDPRTMPRTKHLPANTKFVNDVHIDFLQSKILFSELNAQEGRFDRLADVDLLARALVKLTRAGYDPNKNPRLDPATGRPSHPTCDQFTLDIETLCSPPERLRREAWYPQKASASERAAFEKRYYDGFAQLYIGPLRALRKLGYKNLSAYGWAPFARDAWFEKATVDPQTDWAWNGYGKQIYAEVDVLNPSVYCFLPTPRNVAYTLGNIDNNFKMIRQEPVAKPLRPYYMNLYHGGGGGWRWWREKPLTMEETRAMSAMGFFTGFDGTVLWGSSLETSPRAKINWDVPVGRQFDCRAEGSTSPTTFLRYDVLHITDVDGNGNFRFQKIDKKARYDTSQPRTDTGYGTGPDAPFYLMPTDKLLSNLRTPTEPIAAFIEGLALVKPFELLLRRGEVKIDVSAEVQCAKTLPVVRRVKFGQWHVLATYDPNWETDPSPKTIELKNFDGRAGLTVILPADAQTRIFVLSDLFGVAGPATTVFPPPVPAIAIAQPATRAPVAVPVTQPVAKPAPTPAAPAKLGTINLLPLIDPEKDAVEGDWKLTTDGLVLDRPKAAGVLKLPYAPPEEYDFEIEFTPQSDGKNVNQHLVAAGRSFAWKLNAYGQKPPIYGFDLLDGKLARNRDEAVVRKNLTLEPGQRYTSKVEVRRGTLRALVNGEEYVNWSGEFNRLSSEPVWKLSDNRQLALSTYNRAVIFHRIEVREVTGKGQLARGAP